MRAIAVLISWGLAPGTIGAACDLATTYDAPARVSLLDPAEGTDQFQVQLTRTNNTWPSNATDYRSSDFALSLTTPSGATTVRPNAPCKVSGAKLVCLFDKVDFSIVTGADFVALPSSILCTTGDRNTTTSTLRARPFDEAGAETDEFPGFKTRGKIWDHEISLAPADDDENGHGTLAMDLLLRGSWPLSNSRVSGVAGARVWHQLLAQATLESSVATDEEQYFDSTKLDLGFTWRSTSLDDRLFSTYRVTGFFRPESTFDTDTRDYVYGVRGETLIRMPTLPTQDRWSQIYPYVSLGAEVVDPETRPDAVVPGNYKRATGAFKWLIYLTNHVAFDIDGEVRYLIDDDVAGIDRWTRRWDMALLLQTGDNPESPWSVLMKYTRGEEPPAFEFHEEVLVGLRWGSAAP